MYFWPHDKSCLLFSLLRIHLQKENMLLFQSISALRQCIQRSKWTKWINFPQFVVPLTIFYKKRWILLYSMLIGNIDFLLRESAILSGNISAIDSSLRHVQSKIEEISMRASNLENSSTVLSRNLVENFNLLSSNERRVRFYLLDWERWPNVLFFSPSWFWVYENEKERFRRIFFRSSQLMIRRTKLSLFRTFVYRFPQLSHLESNFTLLSAILDNQERQIFVLSNNITFLFDLSSQHEQRISILQSNISNLEDSLRHVQTQVSVIVSGAESSFRYNCYSNLCFFHLHSISSPLPPLFFASSSPLFKFSNLPKLICIQPSFSNIFLEYRDLQP